MESNEKRALDLFDRIVEMSSKVRSEYMAELERDDPLLHAELSALLRADAEPDTAIATILHTTMDALGAQPDTKSVDAPLVGSLIGAWRITGMLAEGGMGTVYCAERADGQYRQDVALKLIREELSSPRLIDAFVNERNILARLTHPDIVPLLDGGIDPEGRPWYVMQLIEGNAIDHWCDERKLSIRDRVALFARACEPVSFAHRQDVLHQDIKPSNLLVTEDGRPRLLDFGLSSFPRGDADGVQPRIAITTGYTPPDVVIGGSPGIHTDIYALGVILYQLLCAHYPVPPNALHHRPQPPSRLIDTLQPDELEARGVISHRRLARLLKGDLDRIALRCVATDPKARYESVEQLRQDLLAWHAGKPLLAGKGFWSRTASRLHAVRRPLAIAAVLVVLAATGLFGWQHFRAQREASLSSQADRFFETSLGMAAVSSLGNMPPTPGNLLAAIEARLREQAGDGQSTDMLARGLSILARSWATAGDYTKAESLATEAQGMTRGRHTLQSAFNLATLARLQNLQGRPRDAERTARAGLVSLPFQLTAQHRLARLRLLSQVAAAQSGQGRSREAIETLDTAITSAESLPTAIGSGVAVELLVQRGIWQRWRLRMGESEADLTRAMTLAENSDPILVGDALEALVRTVRGSRQPDRLDRALALGEQLLQLRRTTLGQRHPLTGTAHAEHAFIQLLKGDYAGAKASTDLAQEILADGLGSEHPAMARTYMARAHLATFAGDLDAAFDNAEHARRIYESRYGNFHESTLDSRFLLASLLWRRGVVTDRTADLEEARDLIASTIDASLQAHGEVSSHHRGGLALLLAQTGRKQEAQAQIEQGKRDSARQFGADSEDAMMVRLSEAYYHENYGEDPARTERVVADLVRDAGAIDTLFARGILFDALRVQTGWLVSQSRYAEALDAARERKRLAERMAKPEWIESASVMIQSIEKQMEHAGVKTGQAR